MNPRYVLVAERAGHRCEYCRAPEAVFNFPFEVEHILPPVCGGADSEWNWALACRACNLFKSDRVEARDPETEQTVRLFDPHRDRWDEDFQVEPRFGSMVGITPIGRATVEQLNMNASAQRAARIQWLRLGLFP